MKKKTYSYDRTQGGFTLVEILVVVVIISLLAGIVGVSVLNKPAEARVAQARVQINNLKAAVHIYKMEQGSIPTQRQGLQALVAKPTIPPVPESYPADGYIDSRRLPTDPWKAPYIYLVPGRSGESFEIISYGSDRAPGGSEDAADISSSEL